VLALVIFLTPDVKGQDADSRTIDRADQIQTQRSSKSGSLDPAESTVVEKTFSRISHVFQRTRIRVGIGGLGPGAGLTMGSDLQWKSDNDRVLARLWGTGSVHGRTRVWRQPTPCLDQVKRLELRFKATLWLQAVPPA